MSPSNLPPEVLGQIFVACMPEWDSHRLSPYNAPSLLCQVSSHWRAVAIEEPCLWDTIIFPPSNHAQYSRFIHSGGVELWFGRTGRVWPLSFGEEPSEAPSGSLITQYLHIVTRYARRFKHLSLVMTKIMHLESFRRGFPQDIFDQLQSVSLCCSTAMNSYTLHSFPHLVTPFKTASRLESVSFTLLKADPTKFVLPWSQITSIDVASQKRPLDLVEWRSLFQTCRNLQQGTFVFPYCGRSSGRPVLNHPSLKSLTLVLPSQWVEVLDHVPYRPRTTNYDLALLLSAVTFPTIQHLRFLFHPHRKPLHHVPPVCHTMQSTLKTVIFGWPGESNKDAPGEASEFIAKLTREPGVFTALKHIVLPCKPSKVNHIAAVLHSHPRLSVTITVVPKHIEAWMRTIERLEDSSTIGDRINILSTDSYYLICDDNYLNSLNLE